MRNSRHTANYYVWILIIRVLDSCKNNFLDCWLKGNSNIHFPRHLCNVIADINTASGQKLMTTTRGHLMISKKQDEDEQCSDLLQTVWSENNIKGKERLHAHVIMKREKLTLQMKIFHCFSWNSVISSSGFYNTNKYCYKIKKQTW